MTLEVFVGVTGSLTEIFVAVLVLTDLSPSPQQVDSSISSIFVALKALNGSGLLKCSFIFSCEFLLVFGDLLILLFIRVFLPTVDTVFY